MNTNGGIFQIGCTDCFYTTFHVLKFLNNAPFECPLRNRTQEENPVALGWHNNILLFGQHMSPAGQTAKQTESKFGLGSV